MLTKGDNSILQIHFISGANVPFVGLHHPYTIPPPPMFHTIKVSNSPVTSRLKLILLLSSIWATVRSRGLIRRGKKKSGMLARTPPIPNTRKPSHHAPIHRGSRGVRVVARVREGCYYYFGHSTDFVIYVKRFRIK